MKASWKILALGVFLVGGALVALLVTQSRPEITVYKTPT